LLVFERWIASYARSLLARVKADRLQLMSHVPPTPGTPDYGSTVTPASPCHASYAATEPAFRTQT
jgi:hypothetical protein